ncbi:efflux RND transporter periplasmic adaptor subunit [Maribacter sp. 2307ULW6-5]|uniref:efflux RND transporter periplasmic adaptor subunit n=1 Tax=Maribacter sp. 2307ULW6-5 TaxID=3386275 RepID=UPI0039BCE475
MKKLKTTTFLFVLMPTLLFFTACGSKDQEPKNIGGPAVAVTVTKVRSGANGQFLSASGKVAASNSANLGTRMMGYVDKMYVTVGDEVRKGQLLISINNADLRAKAAQADANITKATAAFGNAQKDYERYKNLHRQNSATQKELDDMTSRFEMASAALEAAKQMKNEVNAQFNYAHIRAPFSGVITNTFIDEGDMANPGMTLLGLEAPGQYEVTALVPESEISRIAPNSSVNVVVKSIGETLRGTVAEISTSAKNTGGQYVVKVALEAAGANVLSGMFATVQFPVAGQAKTAPVLIPSEAIITKGQLSGVYTVSQSDTAILRWLRLGRAYGDQVEVLSGLGPEETYIVAAEGKLYNGAKIRVQ